MFPSSSKHFSAIMCFFTPWKHKESFGFMMFSRGLEMHPWSKIGSFYIFGTSGFILSENGIFSWNLVIFNFKAIFYKTENLVGAIFYPKNNLLKVKFLGVVHHNKMHKQNESSNLCFWIICYGSCKNVIVFVTMTTITLCGKSLFI